MTKQDAKALIVLCIDEGLKQGVIKNRDEFEELLDYLDMYFTDTDKMTNGSSEIPKELKEASEKEYPCDKSWMTDSMLDMNAHCQVAFWKGSKWQKEQDEKELSEKIAAAYQLGLADKEKQMLKETVEYEVGMHGEPIKITFDKYVQRARGIFPGEKVRIIIVKEDNHE